MLPRLEYSPEINEKHVLRAVEFDVSSSPHANFACRTIAAVHPNCGALLESQHSIPRCTTNLLEVLKAASLA